MTAPGSMQNKPWFRAVIGAVLVLCVAWIVAFLVRSGGGGGPTLAQPDAAMPMKANELAAKLQEDERFAHLTVHPNPEEPNGLIVSGRVRAGEDLVALDERVKELAAGMPVVIRAGPMEEPAEDGE